MSTRSDRDERRGWAVDTVLAAALTVLSVVAATALSVWAAQPVDALGYVLVVLACGALAVRRRLPVPVLAVSGITVSAYLAIGYPYGPVMFAVVVAVYTVARRLPTVPAVVWSTGAYVLLLVHVFVNPAALPGLLGAIPAAAWVLVPATIGVARRLVLEARARERAETERRLRNEERLHVAQDVHDVVGHGLAAIQMQADIALHLAATKPEQGVAALRAISTASGAALAELRETLRDVTSDGADAPRTPAASVDRLAELCGRIRAAGVEVSLDGGGEPRPLPAAVDTVVYRVVQEALTNVVRHAVSPHATVELDYLPDEIAVTITSPHDGTAVAEGFGIRGIRRRVTGLGGTVAVRVGETLHVRARLPARASTPPPTTPPATDTTSGDPRSTS